MKTRRLFTCLLALALVLALAPAARADVAWEPDNSFYERHAGECSYENRAYQANGAEGFVTAWNAPNGSGVEAQFENGERLWVYWRWKDWGCVSRWEDGKETSGWIPLADLALTYDYIAFEEEYGDRIQPYNNEFADYDGDDTVVNFYEYPGAPEFKESRPTDRDYGDMELLTGKADGNSYIQSVFVDENGLTWGFVGYWFGSLNGWFCLDDPDLGETADRVTDSGVEVPVREVETEELTEAKTPVMPAKGVFTAVLPWALVIAVVAVTAALLALFFRKKKRA